MEAGWGHLKMGKGILGEDQACEGAEANCGSSSQIETFVSCPCGSTLVLVFVPVTLLVQI